MRNSLQQKFYLAFIFFAGLQLSVLYGNSQRYQKEPEPEMALGVKVVTRQIQYGKNSLYITDPTSVALQTVLRYDAPVKIAADRYIALTGQAGFLFCKAKVFDTTFTDPNTNVFIRQRSRNPAYMPLYFGVYNMSSFSIGAEVFYWKGLGTRDIWGMKFLSLGYNGKQFRFSAAGELYAQAKNSKNKGIIFCVDVFVKLISDRYSGSKKNR
jgi:hypothetical protein